MVVRVNAGSKIQVGDPSLSDCLAHLGFKRWQVANGVEQRLYRAKNINQQLYGFLDLFRIHRVLIDGIPNLECRVVVDGCGGRDQVVGANPVAEVKTSGQRSIGANECDVSSARSTGAFIWSYGKVAIPIW